MRYRRPTFSRSPCSTCSLRGTRRCGAAHGDTPRPPHSTRRLRAARRISCGTRCPWPASRPPSSPTTPRRAGRRRGRPGGRGPAAGAGSRRRSRAPIARAAWRIARRPPAPAASHPRGVPKAVGEAGRSGELDACKAAEEPEGVISDWDLSLHRLGEADAGGGHDPRAVEGATGRGAEARQWVQTWRTWRRSRSDVRQSETSRTRSASAGRGGRTNRRRP